MTSYNTLSPNGEMKTAT